MADDSAVQGLADRGRAGAYTFAALFAIESLARSFNASVISVQAYDLLGSSRGVSVLSTCVSIAVLCTTLALPVFLGRLRRRWTYTLGGGLMIFGCLFLASYTISGQAVGVLLRNVGAAVLNVTLSLYILDNIHRSDLTRSEPLRMALSTFSWMLGPAAGIWLYETYGSAGPQLASAITAAVLLVVFWRLRMKETSALPSGNYDTTNPLANVKRFVEQPRLRLAWAIAFGRSCFWATLFIYGPLLMIEGQLGKQFGGILISASQALLLTAFIFGRIAQRIGVRTVVTWSFLMISLTSVGASLFGAARPIEAALLLLIGALFATALDAVGGIPFLRAVRYAERQRMAAVYRTFIEFSEFVPGVIFAVTLSFLPTSAVFGVLGVAILVLAAISWRYLPKSM